MTLNAPSMLLFIIALIIAAVAVVSVFIPIQYITGHAFWVAILAYVVLAVGNVVKM